MIACEDVEKIMTKASKADGKQMFTHFCVCLPVWVFISVWITMNFMSHVWCLRETICVWRHQSIPQSLTWIPQRPRGSLWLSRCYSSVFLCLPITSALISLTHVDGSLRVASWKASVVSLFFLSCFYLCLWFPVEPAKEQSEEPHSHSLSKTTWSSFSITH